MAGSKLRDVRDRCVLISALTAAIAELANAPGCPPELADEIEVLAVQAQAQAQQARADITLAIAEEIAPKVQAA